VEQAIRPGRQRYGRRAGPCGQAPGLCQAVRLAAANDGLGWWLQLPSLQPRQRRDRLGHPAVPRVGLQAEPQVGLQAEPQASDAAAWACRPAVPAARPDLSWQWVCSPHQVWLAAAAWESPAVAVKAQQPGRPQAGRPSFQTRAASEGLVWVLEAAADPIPVRHPEQAVHWKAQKAATTYHEAPPERKCSEPGRRSAVVVLAEPAAALALADVVAEPAAAASAAAVVVAEPAAAASAAAESSVTHPVSVGWAVKGPVFAGSAAPLHFSGGSAECLGTLRQRQAADWRQIQEAGRGCLHQPPSRERLGLHAWPPAALHGLLCFGRSTSLGPEHSRRARLDATPRSPRRG
jgi:hypothetical protein